MGCNDTKGDFESYGLEWVGMNCNELEWVGMTKRLILIGISTELKWVGMSWNESEWLQ